MTTNTKYNVDFKTIGQRIKEAREARSWTQSVLAIQMDYSITYISGIENDHKIPSMRAIRAFEVALGCKLTK